MTNRTLSFIIHRAVRHSANENGGIAQLVEHSVHTRSVICSSQIAATRPVGQKVKTPPFHGGNMGSIPVRVTKKSRHPCDVWIFSFPVHWSKPIGFDHKHFAIVRWPRCSASQLLAQPKETAQGHGASAAGGVSPGNSVRQHSGGSAAEVFPCNSAVDLSCAYNTTREKIGEDFLPSWRLFLGSGGRLFYPFSRLMVA